MARKPLEGTIAQNITKWGTGGINIDACRIKHNEKPKMTKRNGRNTANVWTDKACGFDNTKNTVATADPKGRFPSNVILDEQTTLLLDEQTGVLKSGDNCTRTKTGSFLEHGGLGKAGDLQVTYGDEGGASRFYYCAKASGSERNAGLDSKNNHPTVKPINLMRYLCKLITPKNGVVLDPMCGSGSTCIAAVLEGFNYMGIEMEKEYVDTANKRIIYWSNNAGN
jgi:site-specific DNA-methyltransferase (adenine-specific)